MHVPCPDVRVTCSVSERLRAKSSDRWGCLGVRVGHTFLMFLVFHTVHCGTQRHFEIRVRASATEVPVSGHLGMPRIFEPINGKV